MDNLWKAHEKELYKHASYGASGEICMPELLANRRLGPLHFEFGAIRVVGNIEAGQGKPQQRKKGGEQMMRHLVAWGRLRLAGYARET